MPQCIHQKWFFFALVMILCGLTYLCRPISDWDFFWHLKTGEWIAQNHMLPSGDPFSFTAPSTFSSREMFILKCYWLAQLLYFFVHATLGWGGFVLLRFVLVGALLAALYWRRRPTLGLDLPLSVLFLLMFLHAFALDRPQVFSFVLFAVLWAILGHLKREGQRFPRAGYFGIFGLFVLWGNLHGGVIVGQGTLLVFSLSEGLAWIRNRAGDRSEVLRNLKVAGVGLAGSLANPNLLYVWDVAWMSLVQTSSGPSDSLSLLYATNTEYLSSLRFFQGAGRKIIIIYWLFLGGAALYVLKYFRRLQGYEWPILAGLAFYSFIHVRYIPFFLIVAYPMVRAFFLSCKDLRISRGVPIILALVFVGIFARGDMANLGKVLEGQWLDPAAYPLSAAEFIAREDLQGNMFNNFAWGGYLLWRLGPDKQVFCDGRTLDPDVYRDWYLSVLMRNPAERALGYWRKVFAKYSIDYAVLPKYKWGKVFPLSLELFNDPSWSLVFDQDNAVIFVKQTTQ